MKRIIVLLSVVLFGLSVFAQDCEYFIAEQVGKKIETQDFDAKDKLTSKSITEVISNAIVDGKQEVVVENESFDKDDVSSGKSQLTYYCVDGNFEVDMKSMLDQNQMAGYEGMSIDYTTENMVYPNNMSAGMTLKDGYVEAIILNEGIKMVTFRVDVKNIQVEAVESITTPAGTFEAYKISSDITSKTGFIKIQMSSVQWLVKNVGAVRTETYNKKGKLIGYSVISSIS
jgi:hypothetical protein